MQTTFQPLLETSVAELTDLLNRSFEGYVVPVRFTPPTASALVRTETVDLGASLRIEAGGSDAGIALIARRGRTCRVAAMAIVPTFRGKGVGRAAMERAVADARARGEETITLEVIEQNPAAVRLYEASGLRRVRRLVGFSRGPESSGPVSGEPLVEIDVSEAARSVLQYAPVLPWQISGETIAHLSLPNRAYRLGPALAVISDSSQQFIALRALVVPPEDRGQGWGRKMLDALRSEITGREWRVSAVVPEGLADGFFAACGFRREELSQWQMEMKL